MHKFNVAVLAVGFSLCYSSASAVAGALLKPADAINTARFMAAGTRSTDDPVSVSPDGKRYVVRVVRGDSIKNGIWVDIFTGELASLSAARPVQVAHLFSTGKGAPTYAGPSADGDSFYSTITWVNNDKIAFLFSNEHDVRQVVTIDLATKKTVFETQSPTQVQRFGLVPAGTVVYRSASPEHLPTQAPADGYVVPSNAEAMSIAEGYFDGSTFGSRYADSSWYVRLPNGTTKEIASDGHRIPWGFPQREHVIISPDGNAAIFSAAAETIPKDWDNYADAYEGLDAGYGGQLKLNFERGRKDPGGEDAHLVMALYALDVRSGLARPLWNAIGPIDNWFTSWSPDDRYAVLSGVPLPQSGSGPATNYGTAIVDVSSGAFETVSTTKIRADRVSVTQVVWRDTRNVEIVERTGGSERARCYTLSGTKWQLEILCKPAGEAITTSPSPIKVVVEQDNNTPPKLYAYDSRKPAHKVMLLDLNPDLLTKFTLGNVKFLQGTLSTGEHWTALLTLPANYSAARRYPLVIHSGGTALTVGLFTLYDSADVGGLGPSQVGPYLGQLLAARGIADAGFFVETAYGGPAEAEATQHTFEEFAKKLIDEGVVDEHRVGIDGFSRTGYFASHAITHSKFPFGAALISDNFDTSYVQVVLGDNYTAGEAAVGAPMRGEGLTVWLKRGSGFNADHIHAPVLLMGQSAGTRTNILEHWELFSQLRDMQRPVEMYLMPEIDAHPSHNPQNPAQVMAVENHAIDWFDFWLNGHEDSDPAKRDQYARWEKLCDLQIKQTDRPPTFCVATHSH